MTPSAKNMRIAFVGGGAMAEAIIAGILKAKLLRPSDVTASDILEGRRGYLRQTYGVSVTADNAQAVRGLGANDLVVIAVKPQHLGEATASLRDKLSPETPVLSIVAGAKIATLMNGLRHDRIIRTMPNTPAQVGQGMTAWTATPAVTEAQRAAAKRVLGAFGHEVYLSDEKYLDVATALNGSGPAYVFLFMETLVDAGVYLGLTRDVARELVVQTVLGSAQMAQQSGKHLAELRDLVTSPGGTTAEALLSLENDGFRAALLNAVIAAYEKSQELGAQQKK